MTGDSRRCPDPEVLAAFVAGELSGDELKMTATHLLDCDDCTAIVREAARAAREERVVRPAAAEEHPASSPRRLTWWVAAAAAAIAAVLYFTSRPQRGSAEIRLLVDAAPRDARSIEPRLSGGFPWAPLRSSVRSREPQLDAGQMKLVGAAGAVLEHVRNDPTPAAVHAGAVAQLIAGRSREASERLAQVAPSATDARLWSDLAAAEYQAALQTDDVSHLADALAAADAALRVDPRLPEALFNRALIVERMGLREPARTAWTKYLEVDRHSEWAGEARQHLQKLAPAASFREELERHYGRLAGTPAVARALVQRYPQEARVWGQSEILSRWAHAHQSHDEAAARTHLRVAKEFGAELAARSGESLLSDAVDAIERASGVAADELAAAHIQLREGEKAYKSGNPADAERRFRGAADAFARNGSPAALVAGALAANATYDQGRISEARQQLEALLRRAPAAYIAQRAQVQWELGLVYGSAGRWGEAIRSLETSMASFERLNEKNYATNVCELLAEVYDRIGDPQKAWRYRSAAFQELGRVANQRLKIAVEAAANTAAIARNWPVSLSLLGLKLELTHGPGDEFTYFQTLLLRARIAGEMQQQATVQHELDLASAVLSRVSDAAHRERGRADQLAVEGLVAPSPREAVPLLTRAIEYHQRSGRRMFLPDLLLHRGRAWRALGDTTAAAADFERGIVELETQRQSLAAGDARWGIFTGADDLFRDAIALASRRGDTAAAFRYAERARARTLLESIGEAPAATTVAAPASATVIIEYALLPESVMIFVDRDGDVRLVEQMVDRRALVANVSDVLRDAEANDAARFRQSAARVYTALLAPVAREIAAAHTLVIVPDPALDGVPFAALVDASGRYVVEQHAVVVAPSAAVFTRLRARTRAERRDLHLLVVAGPSTVEGELTPLTATAGETAAVMAEYVAAARLGDAGGDSAAFADRAANADVIHFTGHAEGEPDGTAALITGRTGGDDDRLDAREIARLHLKRTRTVVLAACNTARGQRTGEGTMSVARAFLAAGVPSVVATLWPIDDGAAGAFFPRLHHHLAHGLAPADALRATQLEWIHHHDAPPGMWAAVQIIGS
ncbi:MAG TPA: CHAT domain-containing protein [Thermoanaerobaculia bacterium]|jgi:CHAT domain-containing protein